MAEVKEDVPSNKESAEKDVVSNKESAEKDVVSKVVYHISSIV